MPELQTTSAVLLIHPLHFAFNPETARTNAFLADHAAAEDPEAPARAAAEFDAFVDALRDAGLRTLVYDDTPDPPTPDAVFPNNWISFHDDAVVLYPMGAPSRRREVRPDLIDRIQAELGVVWPRVIDLSPLAEHDVYLEGTGSLVLDRPRRLAFACPSPRTTPQGLDAFAERMNYEIITFGAVDRRGAPCYHTNVMMAIGERFAVVCFDAIPDDADRAHVADRLQAGAHEIIPISIPQRDRFAGNMLALRSTDGRPLIALSKQALDSLDQDQRSRLQRHAEFVSAPLDTIEAFGGGSARCMLAEIHPPADT